MLLWEIDRPLTQLTEAYGFERASRAYHASLQVVRGLRSLVAELGLPCDMREKDSLYLAAGASAKALIEEHALRQRANLPGTFLDHAMLLEHFSITRAGAIVSPDAADADPLLLAHGLLGVAVSRGARLFEAEAVAFDAASHSVGAQLRDGHQIWNGGALIWEDSRPYLYARTTVSGRIIIGGEDSDEIVEPHARDALIPEKSRILSEKLGALWPRAKREIAYRWAGTFDKTRDGLPLIGPVTGKKGIFAAYGYGGNGITFSFLAAQLIGGLIAGETSPLMDDFALERDGSASI
jgi:glycine/D-amino acid oxidase-like deaminating enzyme